MARAMELFRTLKFPLPEPYLLFEEEEVPTAYREQADAYGVVGEYVNIVLARADDIPHVHDVTSFNTQTQGMVQILHGMRLSATAIAQELVAAGGIAFPMPEVLTTAIDNLMVQYGVPVVGVAGPAADP